MTNPRSFRESNTRPPPFSSHFAASAFQALELIDSRRIDIVVADEQVPGMSGSEFLAIVRNRQQQVLRIILSGQTSTERVIAAINSSRIHRFLTKPMEAGKAWSP